MCDDGSFYWHALDFADDFYDGDCPDLELTYQEDHENSCIEDEYEDSGDQYGMRYCLTGCHADATEKEAN